MICDIIQKMRSVRSGKLNYTFSEYLCLKNVPYPPPQKRRRRQKRCRQLEKNSWAIIPQAELFKGNKNDNLKIFISSFYGVCLVDELLHSSESLVIFLTPSLIYANLTLIYY